MILPIADVRSYLGISGTAEDAFLGILEGVCVADLEALSGEYFGEVAEVVEVLDVRSSTDSRLLEPVGEWSPQELPLRRTPTADGISAVRERVSASEDWRVVDLEVDGLPAFAVEGRTLRRIIGSFPEGPATAEITYEAGLDPDAAVPPLVTAALLGMMAHNYRSPSARQLAGVEQGEIRSMKVRFGAGGALATGDYPRAILNRINALRGAWRFA